MPNSHDARVEHERGRNLPGDGISQKCRVGRHEDCTAARCECHCLHGAIPSLSKALRRCPAQGCSRNEGHKGYHLCSVCHVTLSGPAYDEHECYPQNPEIHVELPSDAIARVDPEIQPETLTALDEMMKAVVRQVKIEVFEDSEDLKTTSNLRLERKEPSDEITFAALTAGLGRRGTGR